MTEPGGSARDVTFTGDVELARLFSDWAQAQNLIGNPGVTEEQVRQAATAFGGGFMAGQQQMRGAGFHRHTGDEESLPCLAEGDLIQVVLPAGNRVLRAVERILEQPDGNTLVLRHIREGDGIPVRVRKRTPAERLEYWRKLLEAGTADPQVVGLALQQLGEELLAYRAQEWVAELEQLEEDRGA